MLKETDNILIATKYEMEKPGRAKISRKICQNYKH